MANASICDYYHIKGDDDRDNFNKMLQCLLKNCGTVKRGSKRASKTWGGVKHQCRKKEGKGTVLAINVAYVREHMIDKAQHLFYFARYTKRKRKLQEFCGFLLAREKNINNQRVFYIDLLCSQHRKGSALLAKAEAYAKKQRFKLTALRAATPGLLKYYRNKGYKRNTNACVGVDRDDRVFRRGDLDTDLDDGWWMSKCL